MPKRIFYQYRERMSQKEFRASAGSGAFLLAVSITLNTLASLYAREHASNPVTDIVLSNIPVFDVDQIFVYGSFLFIGFVTLVCFYNPKRIPFAFKTLATFYFIRAGFISLTHLGPFPSHVTLDFQSRIVSVLWGGGDEFFSGHTGAPFLLALTFWKEKTLRNIFLAATAFFAVVVLLGHLHYSIDVASAFFITYTIYQISAWLFPRDKALLEASAESL